MEYTIINNEEAKSLRTSLLLYSKSMISALMHYEKLKIIRSQKMILMKEFDEKLSQIVSIFNQILKVLPEVQSHSNLGIRKSKNSKKKAVKSNNKMSELYSTLEEINKKLNQLNKTS